ncbi:MAG: hypothetical protein PHI35_06610 [Victivallaceae bacterium]|nr:hypothetical protein [Victivallaceae bacterium]
MIAVAETLPSMSGEAAIRKAKLLRGDFSAAGFAGRADNELSNRFNAALDKVFAARREEFAGRENKARELVAELNKLTSEMTDVLAAEPRARAIRAELGELACRNTRRIEDEALAAFGVALENSRARQNAERSQLFSLTAQKVSSLLARVVNGEKPEDSEFAIDGLAAFHKLTASVELMRLAASGDGKALEKLKRAAAAAAAEMDRLCGELERSLGVAAKPAAADPMALAAELQAAMMCGNFGEAKKAKAETADPAKLAADFMNCGAVMPDELAALLKRFEELKSHIKI